MTQTSAVIGTAQYLSPEQARGEPVDARSDVYATGCVLFELLCGHPPFVGDSPVSVAYQHVREDAKPPSQSNRDVPPAVDAIVLKALAKNPLNRYQSAGEMRADTLRAAAGRPVHAEPVMPASDPIGGPAQQTRVGSTGGHRQLPARVGNQQRRRTSGWVIAALSALGVLAAIALVAGLIVSQQPEKQAVPSLVNKSNTEADIMLRNLNLVPQPTSTTGTNCTPNMVLSQDPTASTRVDVGTKISYVWCAGRAQVKIPAVVGSTQANALDQIKNAKLGSKVEEVDSAEKQGIVVEVVPAANTLVAEGTPVTIRVSKGNLKQVPDVSSKQQLDENSATSILMSYGFTVTTAKENTIDPKLAGKVLHQNPAAGSVKDPAKTKVTIFVGDYTPPTPTATASANPTSSG
jgi:serine/threonine-protein kinase